MSNSHIPSVNTFHPILGKTAEDAEAFCSNYTIPTFLHNSEECEKHFTRIELTLNMDACDIQRVCSAELFVDGVSKGKVQSLSLQNLQPILNIPWTEAVKFCESYNIAIVQSKKHPEDLPANRIEVKLYEDAHDNNCIGEAELFRDGVSLGKVTTDECGDCGGPCDGVHANIFSIDAVHGMTQEELKKYFAPHDIPLYCVYAEPTCMPLPYNIQKCSPDRLEYSLRVRKGDPRRKYYVYSAKLYKNNMVVAESVQSVKEKRVNELVDSILRNDRSIVDEVIKQMSVSRVKHIVDTLMAQDPDVVTEVLERLQSS